MFDIDELITGIICLVLAIGVILAVAIPTMICKDKDIELEKYKIEMQYKYNQVNIEE